jgi:hypothetical protein
MTINRRGLREHRRRLYECWSAFVSGDTPAGLRAEVLSSWCRSRGRLSHEVTAAPSGPNDHDHKALLNSVHILENAVGSMLRDSDVVVALADARGQIVWTGGEPVLLKSADSVNYAPGALWDEGSVGINAMSLALSTGSVASVWSAEHWSPVLHEWSCHAAPIHHPTSGRQLGVLNLSTPWDMAHPLIGMAASVLAERLAVEMAASGAGPMEDGNDIFLSVLGGHHVTVSRRPMRLTRRQIEIMLLLALRPEGVGLCQLHADLYGDGEVQLSTLKAEVSHLRRLLGGRISRAPYRIEGQVRADVLGVLEDLRHGHTADAVTRYKGALLPWSESPRILMLARTVEVALRDAVLGSDDYEAALELAKHFEDDAELVDHILDLLPPGDRRRHLLVGQLSSIT